MSGFGQDEESCGIIDVTSMLGGGEKLAFLFDTQAHYTMDGELVEGGQLMAMYYDLPNGGDCRYSGGGADFPTCGSSSDQFVFRFATRRLPTHGAYQCRLRWFQA